jgi:alpha-1,2-mannosyltransferase
MKAVAAAAWVLPFAAVAILVGTGLMLQSPLCRVYACSDLVWRSYMGAAQHWLAREPLYDANTIYLFQYFPQAALLFVPFYALGAAGGVLWRAVGWGLFAAGLRRVTRFWPERDPFAAVSVLVIAPSAMALLSGQTNLLLAAAMLHAVCELEERPARAAAWLMLALACKPIALVPILLAAVHYPRARRPLAVGAILFAAAPFATAPAAYVIAQSRACLVKLAVSARPERHFEELRGLLWKLGWSAPNAAMLALQILGALGAVALVVRVRRHFKAPFAALLLYAVAAAYLMIFNPRTQPNSFVIAAPAVALPAALLLGERRLGAAFGLIAILVAWSGAAHFAENWLKPLASIAFAILLVRELFWSRWMPSKSAVHQHSWRSN